MSFEDDYMKQYNEKNEERKKPIMGFIVFACALITATAVVWGAIVLTKIMF